MIKRWLTTLGWIAFALLILGLIVLDMMSELGFRW